MNLLQKGVLTTSRTPFVFNLGAVVKNSSFCMLGFLKRWDLMVNGLYGSCGYKENEGLNQILPLRGEVQDNMNN